jgi:hypothetical protein
MQPLLMQATDKTRNNPENQPNFSSNTSPKPNKTVPKKYIYSVYSKKPVNDLAKVFVLPRDYRTPKYNPMLYEESLKQESNSINHKLPTIDDVEYASKSI